MVVLVYDHEAAHPALELAMRASLASGRVLLEEETHMGLEAVPAALRRLMSGEHRAEVLVAVA
jgi:NADPH-dependent curcumin reductase CurA